MKDGPAAGTLAPMGSWLALWIVALAGAFLFVLGLLALVAPTRARGFLLGFAGTAPRHFLELFLRALVGAALVVASPRLAVPGVFAGAGWVLLGTTVLMAALPWRVHRDFARHAVPRAMAFLPLIGVASLAAGSVILRFAWPGLGAG